MELTKIQENESIIFFVQNTIRKVIKGFYLNILQKKHKKEAAQMYYLLRVNYKIEKSNYELVQICFKAWNNYTIENKWQLDLNIQ